LEKHGSLLIFFGCGPASPGCGFHAQERIRRCRMAPGGGGKIPADIFNEVKYVRRGVEP